MATHMTTSRTHQTGRVGLPYWFFLGIIVFLIVITLGLALWLSSGNTRYRSAHQAYLAADCSAALPLYAQSTRYPTWAGSFVSQARREEAECTAFVGATKTAGTANPAESIQAWEAFYAAYAQGPLAPQALVQLRQQYLAWAQVQRTAGDYASAIATYRQMATSHAEWAVDANAGLSPTYLAWGEGLRTAGDFAHAIAVYDEMAAISSVFAADALAPRNQVFLAWGADLTQRGAFAEAAQVYRLLLQREHERLAPLDLPERNWPITWLYPYALSQHDLAVLKTSLHEGPGMQYPATQAPGAVAANRFPGIVGASPDGQWLALDLTHWTAEPKSEPGLLTTLPDIAWQRDPTAQVAWAPIAAAPLSLTTTITLPVAGGLLQALATRSEAASQALGGLATLYTNWGAAAQAAGDDASATAAYLALADLTSDAATREQAYGQLAQIHLALAQQFTEQHEYQVGLVHVRQAETFDPTGKLARPVQALHSQILLSLGDQALATRSWDIAARRYGDVLAFERSAFGKGQAFVKQKGARLLASADAKASVVQTVEPGQALTTVAQQTTPAPGWIALLAPVAPTALAWAPATQVTLTVAALPDVATANLPPLQSHIALVNLAHTQQTWGQTLAGERKYEEAVAHYRAILDDGALRSVITGTADLLAQNYTAWGDMLIGQDKMVDAVARYGWAVSTAPKSDAGVKASEALSKQAADTVQAVSKGAGCDAVSILDALVKTTVKAKADSALPQALYQCGQARLTANVASEARAAYQRIIDSYGKSAYAAKARRGIQEIDWAVLINKNGIDSAANTACDQAGVTVRGRVANIAKPYVVYVNGGSTYWYTDFPAAWQGSDKETNAIVCLGDVQSYLVESCPYTNNHWIKRYRSYRTVRLVDAVGRLLVAQGKLYGSSPNECPFSEWFSSYLSTKTYEGDIPDSADLTAWLKKYLPVK